MTTEKPNSSVPVSPDEKKVSTTDLITKMMADSRINRAELEELATRYEAEKVNIAAETRTQVESLLQSTVKNMLDGRGLELNKDNVKILEKYLGGEIPKDISDRINQGEQLTLISKDSKLIEKGLLDMARGLFDNPSISGEQSVKIWKELAGVGYGTLDPKQKEAYQQKINEARDTQDLTVAGKAIADALNLALGDKVGSTPMKTVLVHNDADRKAATTLLESVRVASIATPESPTVAPAPVDATAKTESSPSTVENTSIDTTSLEGFLNAHKYNGNNFGAELQKNAEALGVVKSILGLSATASYKEVRSATIDKQKALGLSSADGAFGPKTLAAYKKATPEVLVKAPVTSQPKEAPAVTETPPKVEAPVMTAAASDNETPAPGGA